MPSDYRSEIDGLRAIAVLAVIAFHINHTWLPGGFLGVDVFFVISGYLITSLILRDLERGTFSLWRFYERRARRILPALVTVIGASAAASWFLMDTVQFWAFGQSVVAQIAFAGNVLFWQQTGYFAEAASTLPLLHTWTLAVEEQFYVLFPVLLLLGWSLIRRQIVVVAIALAAASFLCARYVHPSSPAAVFYLLPFRAWELLAGATLAMVFNRMEPSRHRHDVAAIGGLITIIAVMILFKPMTRHPMHYTGLVVLGTAVFIRYGQAGIARAAMSVPPLVFTGKISYSLYLWHWPILAFGRLHNLGGDPNWIASLAASFVLATMTWLCVEQPFRDRNRTPLRVFTPSIAAAWALALITGVAILATGGFPHRLDYPPGLEASFAREPTIGTCVDNIGAHVKPDGWFCELGTVTQGPIDFIVTGDSHAYALLPAFRAIANQKHARAIAISDSGCLPFLGLEMLRGDQNETDCRLLNERLLRLASHERPRTVVLVARWTYYSALGQMIRDYTTRDAPIAMRDRIALMQSGLARTIVAYSAIGVSVVVVGQVPEQTLSPRSIYRTVYASPLDRRLRLDALSVKVSDHIAAQAPIMQMFRASNGITFIDPTSVLCSTVCAVGTLTKSFYSDVDHLSAAGSMNLIGTLGTMFAE